MYVLIKHTYVTHDANVCINSVVGINEIYKIIRYDVTKLLTSTFVVLLFYLDLSITCLPHEMFLPNIMLSVPLWSSIFSPEEKTGASVRTSFRAKRLLERKSAIRRKSTEMNVRITDSARDALNVQIAWI